jgi:hypothetical protein
LLISGNALLAGGKIKLYMVMADDSRICAKTDDKFGARWREMSVAVLQGLVYLLFF